MKKPETVLREWALNSIRFNAGGKYVRHWTIKGITQLTEGIQTGSALTQVEFYETKKGPIIQGDMRDSTITNWKRMMAVRDHFVALKMLDQLTPLWLSKRTGISLLWRQLVWMAADKGIALDGNNEVITDEKSIDAGPAQIWEIKT